MNINKYRKLQFILKYRVTVLIISIGKLKEKIVGKFISERGDVPGWVLVVLMTTGVGLCGTFAGYIASILMSKKED